MGEAAPAATGSTATISNRRIIIAGEFSLLDLTGTQIIAHIQNSKTYKLNRKSEIKQKEVVTEVQRLVAETELQLEKFPILTSILNSLGTRKLELKEFTEVSIQDLYGDQGVFFSIENFEKNYSLTRLSILSKQLKYGGYATLSKVIEKQIKFLSS